MVTVRVEHGDVLDRRTDLLVLKYAQALHGVDRAAVKRERIPLDSLPEIGRSSTYTRPPRIGADSLVFLGVKGLDLFGYAEIREFGRRAIAETADLGPREICMTLHGAGYGLDEAEAFRAEVAGVYDAVDAAQHGRDLDYVTIVDIDDRRVDRLRNLLDGIVRRRTGPSRQPSDDSAGRGSDSKRHAFVAMPFADDFYDYFHYGIRPPLEEAGLLCERMDEANFTGDVVAMMKKRIRSAQVVVADLTDANPNVYLEVGYAWASERQTILLCRHGAEPRFDVRGHRQLRYSSILELETKLRSELDGLEL